MSRLRKSSTLPAVTYNVNPNDYHRMGNDVPRGDRRKIMSRGELVNFSKCPAKWVRNAVTEETDCMAWGSLVDCLKLTPERFEMDYAVCPETYPAKGAKKDDPVENKPWIKSANFCKTWEKEQEAAGKTVVKSDDVTEARQAVARLEQDARIMALLKDGQKQVQACCEYHDEETGIVVPLKILLDLVPAAPFDNWLADLKTTDDASPQKWVKHIFNFGLHKQAAMYLDVWNCATGGSRNQWAHIVQESSFPFEPARRMLDVEFIGMGKAAYLNALEGYCQCLATGRWPGYDDEEGLNDPIVDGWRVCSPEPWMILKD